MDLELKALIDLTFGSQIRVKEDASEFLLEAFQKVEFDSRQMIVEAGGQANHFYLVQYGVQMIYFISEKGDKVILGFSYHGNVSGVYDAFIRRTPSQLFLEAITLSKLYALSYAKYQELFDLFPEFFKWRTYFTESILFGRLTRESEMMTASAKERFDAFIQRCPKELLDIPQKYLASYLGMKPETFSRLRALRD